MKPNASLMIGTERFYLMAGWAERIEIVRDYGLVADGLTADLGYEAVRDRVPELIHSTHGPPLLVTARIALDEGKILRFTGSILPDDVTSAVSSTPSARSTVNISARSILSKLLDDDEPLEDAIYERADWSDIVADMVKKVDFRPDRVEPSGVLAKDGDQGVMVFDGSVLREVVEQAVKETGFYANVLPDGTFVFAPKPSIPSTTPELFRFKFNDMTSDIRDYNASEGRIKEFSARKLTDTGPASPITLFIPGDERYSGRYWVTKSRHQRTLDDDRTVATYNIERELPELGETE
jgi:hypothetical protein